MQPGDRIEYWLTTLEDGRTVHRGTVVAVYAGGVVAVREDGKDYPDLILPGDVIRTI
jgi:hypothetical protein